MRNIRVTNTPTSASIGYTLLLGSTAVGSRVTTGIVAVGVSGNAFMATIDETTCDGVQWDDGHGWYSNIEDISPPIANVTVTSTDTSPLSVVNVVSSSTTAPAPIVIISS